MISLCYASGDCVCPGSASEARLYGTEELNALENLSTFFWLSYQLLFLFSLLSILSSLFTLLKTQPPVLESSSVTDGVYNIDVDVSHDCCVALPHETTGLFAVCD